MTFVNAVKTCFRKYGVFKGRASRSEFWWFVLALTILSSALQTIESSADGRFSLNFGLKYEIGPQVSFARNVFSVFTILPLLAVVTRRLHDIGRPGWQMLIPVVAFVAILVTAVVLEDNNVADFNFLVVAACVLILAIICVIFLSRRSDPGPNQYGPNPHEVPQ